MLLIMDYMDNLGNYLSTQSYIKKFTVTGIVKDNNNKKNDNKIYLPSD